VTRRASISAALTATIVDSAHASRSPSIGPAQRDHGRVSVLAAIIAEWAYGSRSLSSGRARDRDRVIVLAAISLESARSLPSGWA
jgi:hypothetical protein